MNERVASRAIQDRLAECARHEEKILAAYRHLLPYFPFTVDKFLHLDEITSGFLDQFVYRFSKLQDTLGERIFPALLLLGKEEVKGKTFLDILHRMEELDLLNADEWIDLRELRNEIAHEYSHNADEVVQALNMIIEKSSMLLIIYTRVREFIKIKYDLK